MRTSDERSYQHSLGRRSRIYSCCDMEENYPSILFANVEDLEYYLIDLNLIFPQSCKFQIAWLVIFLRSVEPLQEFRRGFQGGSSSN